MNRLFELLARHNRREQTILLVGALAIVLYILWMGVISPLQQTREEQINRNQATNAALGRVKILAAKVKQGERQANQSDTDSGANLSQIVDSTLQSVGLRMSGFQPGTRGEVRVRLDNVNYGPFVQWLYNLEYKHDISIRDLSVAAATDPGQVTANIRLSKN